MEDFDAWGDGEDALLPGSDIPMPDSILKGAPGLGSPARTRGDASLAHASLGTPHPGVVAASPLTLPGESPVGSLQQLVSLQGEGASPGSHDLLASLSNGAALRQPSMRVAARQLLAGSSNDASTSAAAAVAGIKPEDAAGATAAGAVLLPPLCPVAGGAGGGCCRQLQAHQHTPGRLLHASPSCARRQQAAAPFAGATLEQPSLQATRSQGMASQPCAPRRRLLPARCLQTQGPPAPHNERRALPPAAAVAGAAAEAAGAVAAGAEVPG
jgi:hypothetical protein